MGLFDMYQPKDSNEDAFKDELKDLKAQESSIISQIGEKFVEENRTRDMSGTRYEDLFAQLSEVEKELDRVLDESPIDDVFGEHDDDDTQQFNDTGKSILTSKVVISGTVLFVVLCLALGLALLNRQPKVDLGNAETSQEAEPVVTQEASVNTVTVSPEELMAEFGLFKSNRAEYSNAQVLDYAKYKKYESDIEGFSFRYPSDIFNEVTVENDKEGGAYGKIIRQVNLKGSDGSFTEFTVYENGLVSQSDVEAMTEYVLNTEKSSVFTPTTLVNQVSKDKTSGTVKIKAYTDGGSNSECANILCAIRKDKIYRMKIVYPRPTDEEEDKQKAYYCFVMNCFCDFNDNSKDTPDTYENFVRKEYEEFQLASWQKDIFWGMMNNMVVTRELYDQYGKEYVVPVGTRQELAEILSEDELLLQMYLHAGVNKDSENIQSDRFACIVDHGSNGTKMYFKSEIGKEEFEQFYSKAIGEKNVLNGSLDYAKTFYRDMFSLELDTGSLLQDNPGVYPGDSSLLLYSKDYNELVYASGYTAKNRVDGPDDWDYNEEMDCFDYHMGPVYELTSVDLNWQQKRDEEDPGNGIYVAHIRPYSNNSVGFELLGIERVE